MGALKDHWRRPRGRQGYRSEGQRVRAVAHDPGRQHDVTRRSQLAELTRPNHLPVEQRVETGWRAREIERQLVAVTGSERQEQRGTTVGTAHAARRDSFRITPSAPEVGFGLEVGS